MRGDRDSGGTGRGHPELCGLSAVRAHLPILQSGSDSGNARAFQPGCAAPYGQSMVLAALVDASEPSWDKEFGGVSALWSSLTVMHFNWVVF